MTIFSRHSRPDFLVLGIVFGASVAVLFAGLSRAPVYLWDEARVAINAIEWRNPLVVTFHGEPDFWNPKPPLSIAITALSLRLGGLNEVALRIPSAVAALATVISTFFFTRWTSRSRTTALLAALILLGTGGYVEEHVARSAEPDSLFVLFTTLTAFTLARLVNAPVHANGNRAWIYTAAVCFVLAMMTKGVAALLIVPGLVAGIVASERARLIGSREAVISASALALLAIVFWGGRELAQPGFLAAMWRVEIVRFGEPVFGAGDHWYFYVLRLFWPWQAAPFVGYKGFLATASAFPWSLLVVATTPSTLFAPDHRVRQTARLLFCCLGGFVIVLSAANSMLLWYVAPAYPLIAVLAALGAAELARTLSKRRSALETVVGKMLMPGVLMLAVASIGFVIWKNFDEARLAAKLPGQRLGYALRQTVPRLPAATPVRVIPEPQVMVPAVRNGRLVGEEPYDGPTEFYVTALRRTGRDVRIVAAGYEAKPGEVVIGCGAGAKLIAGLAKRALGNGCFAWQGPPRKEPLEARKLARAILHRAWL